MFSSEKADVKTTESILKILHNAPGLSLSAAELQGVIARSGEEANKARLKADTEKLVKEQQAFGAPWMLVTREDGQQRAFWGPSLSVSTSPSASIADNAMGLRQDRTGSSSWLGGWAKSGTAPFQEKARPNCEV